MELHSASTNFCRSANLSAELLSDYGLAAYVLLVYVGGAVAMVAVVAAAVFIWASVRGLRMKRLAGHQYAFLINRTSADLGYAIVVLVISFLVLIGLAEPENELVMTVDFVMFLIPCIASMMSYFYLSCLKLIAVMKPLYYRTRITGNICSWLVIDSWGGGVFLTLIIAVATWLEHDIKGAESMPSLLQPCATPECMQTLKRVYLGVLIFNSIIYLLTCGSYILMCLALVRQYYVRKRTTTPSSEHMASIWKIGVHVVTFVAFYFLSFAGDIYMYLNYNQCFFVQHYHHMLIWWATIRVCALVKGVLDVLIGFLVDARLRQVTQSIRRPNSTASNGMGHSRNSSKPTMDAAEGQPAFQTKSLGINESENGGHKKSPRRTRSDGAASQTPKDTQVLLKLQPLP